MWSTGFVAHRVDHCCQNGVVCRQLKSAENVAATSATHVNVHFIVTFKNNYVVESMELQVKSQCSS